MGNIINFFYYEENKENKEQLLDCSTLKYDNIDNSNLKKANIRSELVKTTYQKYAPDISIQLNINNIINDLPKFKLINTDNGFTSNIEIYEYNDLKIIKKIYKFCNKNSKWYVNDNFIKESFKNELAALYLLRNEDYFPKLISYDIQNMIIIMTYCGNKIARVQDKIPSNWKFQMFHILNILKKYNIYHNDITERNICLLNNQLYLIDFGNCKNHIDLYYRNYYPDLIYNSKTMIDFLNKINDNAIEIRKCSYKLY